MNIYAYGLCADHALTWLKSGGNRITQNTCHRVYESLNCAIIILHFLLASAYEET